MMMRMLMNLLLPLLHLLYDGKKNNKSNVTAKDVDEELLKALRGTQDEDTNFALFIVPSLQSLTAEEKLDVKISILNMFRDVRMARRRQSTSQALYDENMVQQP
jgi:hypothetical protein